ncbi:MAG: hypothetical protein Q9190_002901 [Brigantiaea leucoxantha]
MFASKSTLFAAIFALSTGLVAAAPPSCLLAAVNTESNPADLPTICGPHSSKVKAELKKLCNENVDAAMEAFNDVCKSVGKPQSSDSSPSSTSLDPTLPSATGTGSDPEATTTGSGSSLGSDSGSDSESGSGSNSDVVVTGPSSPSGTAAPYPIVYTSTYYDEVCSCTKTAAVSSTGVSGSTGFVTGTGFPYPTGTATGGTGVGPIASATGSPITPAVPKGTGSGSFTGAANKEIASFSTAIIAFIGLTMAAL